MFVDKGLFWLDMLLLHYIKSVKRRTGEMEKGEKVNYSAKKENPEGMT